MPIALQLFLNQFRTGAFNIIIASLALAAFTATMISLTVSAIQATLTERASFLLAADVQIRGSEAIPEPWLERLQALDLRYSQALTFRAMVFSDSDSQIYSVKAVDTAYPLKGEILIDKAGATTATDSPLADQVLVPDQLLRSLNTRVGDRVDIGAETFTIAAPLVREPDNLRGNIGFAPTILIPLSSVEATQVIQPGSRYQTILYISGKDEALSQFEQWVKPQLGNHFSWKTPEQTNRAIDATQRKAQNFFYLGMTLSMLLSGVAIGLGANKYTLSQGQSIALLKTLGMGPKAVGRTNMTIINALALVGITPGIALALMAYRGLDYWIRPWIADLQSPQYSVMFITLSGLYCCLLAFSAPYFLRLKTVSPMVALREKFNPKAIDNKTALAIGFTCLAVFCIVLTRQVYLVLYIVAALLICYLFTVTLAKLVFRMLVKSAPKSPPWLSISAAQLDHHKHYNAPQVAMLSILFTLIFTMVIMRTSLLEQWQNELPVDTPNIFIFNLFDDEKRQLQNFFDDHEIVQNPLYPMVRARVIRLNESPIDEVIAANDEGINYEREMNITWSTQLAKDNSVIDGRFESSSTTAKTSASLEARFAQGMGAELGDQLTLSFQGQEHSVEVTSIREVNWGSFNPNFFIILNRPPPANPSPNWLTSVHLTETQKVEFYAWLKAHPTVTMANIDEALTIAKEIIDQVSITVEVIGILVLTAGLFVLIASLQITLSLRTQEVVIFRVFGAAKTTIDKILLLEYGVLAATACLIGCVAAEAAIYLISSRLFDLDFSWHPWLWVVAPVLCIPIVTAVCYVSTRRTFMVSPVAALREIGEA